MKLRFCVICGTNKDLQHHHIIPKAEGGDDHQWNLLTLCFEHHNFIHNIRRTRTEGHFKSLIERGQNKQKYNPGGRPPLSKKKRDTIIFLRNQGMSYRSIRDQTGIAVATIGKTIKKHKETDEYLELYSVGGCD